MNSRYRRLYADYERVKALFADHPRIRILEVTGDPPNRYVIEYKVKGLIETRQGIQECGVHRVQITLGENYPSEMPICVVLGTPVFHPNIDPMTICTEDLSVAGRRLEETIVFIGREITYQAYNLKSPRNGDAVRWTEENKGRLPLETVELMPRALLEGAHVPVPTIAQLEARTAPPPVVAKCANCGREEGVDPCAAGHLACPDCQLECANCGKKICAQCTVLVCHHCKDTVCADCGIRCARCGEAACPAHAVACATCRSVLCPKCIRVCAGCKASVCDHHINAKGCCPLCVTANRHPARPPVIPGPEATLPSIGPPPPGPAVENVVRGSAAVGAGTPPHRAITSEVAAKPLEVPAAVRILNAAAPLAAPPSDQPPFAQHEARTAAKRPVNEQFAPLVRAAAGDLVNPPPETSPALPLEDLPPLSAGAPLVARPIDVDHPSTPEVTPARVATPPSVQAVEQNAAEAPPPWQVEAPQLDLTRLYTAPLPPRRKTTYLITPTEALQVPESALVHPPPHVYIRPSGAGPVSGKAVASLIMGIIGLPVVGILTGGVAVLLGFMALSQIKGPRRFRGRTIAIAGIVLGLLDIAVWVVLTLIYGPSLFTTPIINGLMTT